MNAIPLGGFNKLAGEEDPNVPGSLAGKSIPVRLIVLSAGSIMNILLPIVLLSIAFMIPHLESVSVNSTDKGQVFVMEVVANSPAAKAGIKVNDIILDAKGEPVQNVNGYENIILSNLGTEITVTVKHYDGSIAEVKLTPQVNAPASQGATGVAITNAVRKSDPFWVAIPNGAKSYWNMIVLFVSGIVGMIKGSVPVNLTGPVGLAQLTGEIVKTGIANLLSFAAVISLNLGIINIFPIPAMDGGRIVFVLLEWVRRGKRVSPKTEAMVHSIGFMLLMLLFIVISYHDILRIIQGGSIG
jgi:regulator of sigma E protease